MIASSGQRSGFGLHDLLVVLASACLVLDGIHFPGTPFPASTVLAAFLVFLAYFKVPRGVKRPRWFVVWLIALVAWLGLASAMNSGLAAVDVKRFLNISLWAMVAVTVASGRLSWRRIGVGLALGVSFAVVWGVATIGSSSYAGRLTGVLGDPNSAGLIILTLTCLAIPQLQSRRTQIALSAVALVGIVTTLSRTTWLATACVVVWLLAGKHISRWVGFAAVGGLVWWSTSIGDAVLATSQFSDRSGSDALRGRILASEQILAGTNPLIGHGLGSAHVRVDGLTFFFHSSYMSLRQEGGWIALLIYLILLIVMFFAITSMPKLSRSGWAEAALIGVAICAVNLGEVFLTVPAALALGFAATQLGMRRTGMSPAPTRRAGQGKLRSA